MTVSWHIHALACPPISVYPKDKYEKLIHSDVMKTEHKYHSQTAQLKHCVTEGVPLI